MSLVGTYQVSHEFQEYLILHFIITLKPRIMLWIFDSAADVNDSILSVYIYYTKTLYPITEKNGAVFVCINIYIHAYVCVYIPKLLLTSQTVLGFERD